MARKKATADPSVLDVRRSYTATKAQLLKSLGPEVVTTRLEESFLVYFVRRLDLLDLVASDTAIPTPLTARVAEMVYAGAVTEEMMTPAAVAETIQSMRAITVAAVVSPPDEYLTNPDFEVEDVKAADCTPLFVMPGETPGPDQLDVRALTVKDLRQLVAVCLEWGPGALFSFRVRQDAALAALSPGAKGGDAAEPDPGGS